MIRGQLCFSASNRTKSAIEALEMIVETEFFPASYPQITREMEKMYS